VSVVHIVDDDEAIRDALECLFLSRGVTVQLYDSAETFLDKWHPTMIGCLLLDMRMSGMSGLDLYDRLLSQDCRMPVIFLTGHGDVPMAVSALKKGAADFVEKPFNDNELVDNVIAALELDAKRRQAEQGCADVEARLAQLTLREQQVMKLVLDGKMNKVIADDLGITMRTVEVHRAHVFEKMGVKTAVELARLLSGHNLV